MFVYYLRLALISMKRNPVLTGLMVLAIAVGIGASMTTFTVLYLLSGDPLPGRSAPSGIRLIRRVFFLLLQALIVD